MPRIICVSNRVSLPDPETGQIKAGGLAVGVKAALESMGGGIWFGWSGKIEDDAGNGKPALQKAGEIEFHTISLRQSEYDGYYKGMANEGLWPLMHELGAHIDENGDSFVTYQDVNRRFAGELQKIIQPDDVVWIHDYHLLPLGRELRRLGVENRILFFNHIPVPSRGFIESGAVKPRLRAQYKELLDTLFAYDQVGFQSFRDLRNFMGTIGQTAPLPPRFETKTVRHNGKSTAFGVFPISIETAALERKAKCACSSAETLRLRSQFEGMKLVIGAERLDYTKGLPERIEAVSRFLSDHPSYRGKVQFLQITPLSRADMNQYKKTIAQVRRQIAAVQHAHATDMWSPIRYSEKPVPRDTLIGHFRLAAAGLVTSLADGQNLVAKEYLAAQDPGDPGVLVLSRFAGAAEELGENGALLIDPRDPDDVAARLKEALEMPRSERVSNHRKALAWLRKHDIDHWAAAFLRPA